MAKFNLSEDQLRELQKLGIIERTNPDDLTMFQAIKIFLDDVIREESPNPRTVDHYHYVLETFYGYVVGQNEGQDPHPNEITQGFMKGYYNWLLTEKPSIKGNLTRLLTGDNPMTPEEIARKYPEKVRRGLSVASADSHFRTLRKFFRWLHQERGYISDSPLRKFRMPKPYITEREVISEEEFARMLNLCNVQTYIGLRDYTILNFLWDTGMRSGETSQLKVFDLDTSERLLMIRKTISKTESELVIPLSHSLTKLLEKWIEIAELRLDSPVFPSSRDGGHFGRSGIYHLVRRLAKRAGIERNIRPHLFRYTFVTRVTSEMDNHLLAQRLAGHRYIGTTALYYRPTARQIQKVRDMLDERVANSKKQQNRPPRKKRLFE